MRANRILKRKRFVEKRKQLKRKLSKSLALYRLNKGHLTIPPSKRDYEDQELYGRLVVKYNSDMADYQEYKSFVYENLSGTK